MKNRLKAKSGPQGVLLGVLGDLRIIKMLPRGTQMHPQDTMGNLRVGGMRRQPGKYAAAGLSPAFNGVPDHS